MTTNETTMTLTFTRRERTGTTGANAERHQKRVPAILYGHGTEPLPISIDARTLDELLHSGGRRHVIDADVAGTRDTVLLRSVQRDPVTHAVIHADFQRVSRDESVTASVPVVTVGAARGVREQGGVLDVVTHQIDIEGPADRLPEQLEVDVTGLGVHEHLTAAQIPLAAGFKLITPPETIVVSIAAPRTEREATAPGLEETTPAQAPES